MPRTFDEKTRERVTNILYDREMATLQRDLAVKPYNALLEDCDQAIEAVMDEMAAKLTTSLDVTVGDFLEYVEFLSLLSPEERTEGKRRLWVDIKKAASPTLNEILERVIRTDTWKNLREKLKGEPPHE